MLINLLMCCCKSPTLMFMLLNDMENSLFSLVHNHPLGWPDNLGLKSNMLMNMFGRLETGGFTMPNNTNVLTLLGHEQLCFWLSTVAASLLIIAHLAINRSARLHRRFHWV
ncbi:unnamed protein product [Lactuca saligna]|uniref:Uncharacterized protein n=1 Tax=Lactuca saligna TaxID=75948 RepID=A0AA35UNX6_LACSI|nr:unnamed protein product [Lactuca saligna]